MRATQLVRLIGASALVLGVAACGDDDDAADAPDPETVTEEPEDTTPADPETVTGEPEEPEDTAPADPETVTEEPEDTASEPTAGPGEHSQGILDLIAAAEEEGATLTANWHLYTPETWDAWEADFEETYGIDLTVEVTPNGDTRQSTSIAIQEFEAGRPASFDLITGSQNHTSLISNAGAAAEIDWAALDGNIAEIIRNNPNYLDKNQPGVHTLLLGMTYNRDVISDEEMPGTVVDLVDLPPEIALGSNESASNFQWFALPDYMGEDFVPWFRDEFAPRVDGIADCADTNAVTSGRLDILVYDCGPGAVNLANQDGANLGWKIPTDGAWYSQLHCINVKNAVHPNTAALFCDYLNGLSAQQIMYEHNGFDLAAVPGSQFAELIQGYVDDGVDFLVLTSEILDQYPFINDEIRPTIIPMIEQRA